MFTVPASNPHLKRTIRPLYAHHQATAWAGFLDPAYAGSPEIYPGTVMARINVDGKGGEVFTPYTGATGQVPFGLSAFFVSSSAGVDEITDSGSNTFTVWVGDGTALFEILAPAFDQEAAWDEAAVGELLTANDDGLLTTGGDSTNAIAELIEVIGTDKITVRPFRPIPAVTG